MCCDLTIPLRAPTVAAAGWLQSDAVLSLEGVLDGEDQHAEGPDVLADRWCRPRGGRFRVLQHHPERTEDRGHDGAQQTGHDDRANPVVRRARSDLGRL